jgi:hypothetical protein
MPLQEQYSSLARLRVPVAPAHYRKNQLRVAIIQHLREYVELGVVGCRQFHALQHFVILGAHSLCLRTRQSAAASALSCSSTFVYYAKCVCFFNLFSFSVSVYPTNPKDTTKFFCITVIINLLNFQ